LSPSSVYTIPLIRPGLFSSFPINRVYLIKGEKNILIDTGHLSQKAHLEKALHTIGINTDDISEIYYTNHSADTLGNASDFKNALHFSCQHTLTARDNLTALLTLIKGDISASIFSKLEDFLSIPDLPEIETISDAGALMFNELEMDVVCLGARALFLNEEISFVGEIPMGALPPLLPDPDALQRIVNRAQNLAEGSIYSSFRAPFHDASWFFKQTQRFFQAFQQSATLDVSLSRFCENDLGGKPDDDMFWALSLLKFASFYLPTQAESL